MMPTKFIKHLFLMIINLYEYIVVTVKLETAEQEVTGNLLIKTIR